jgi:hypothetical protein
MTASLSESTFSTAPQQGQVRSKLCGFFDTTSNNIPKLVDLGHPSFSLRALGGCKKGAPHLRTQSYTKETGDYAI